MIRPAAAVLAFVCGLLPASAFAHSGPAFPVVTDQRSGPYTVSIWTDPDTTDDGRAAGRFWVVVTAGAASPPAARVRITATPRNTDEPTGGASGDGRGGQRATGRITTVDVASPGRDGHTYYGAVLMDHEGPYGIDVSVTGPAGDTVVRTSVDATYDLRPSPLTAALYLLPFVMVGLLWMRMLIRRSQLAKAARTTAPVGGSETIHAPPVPRR